MKDATTTSLDVFDFLKSRAGKYWEAQEDFIEHHSDFARTMRIVKEHRKDFAQIEERLKDARRAQAGRDEYSAHTIKMYG